jgi:streptogramin lyase
METPSDEGAEGFRPEGVACMQTRLRGLGRAVVPAVDTGETKIFEAPDGRGPYGIATTPNGSVYYASLAGSYVGAVSPDGSVTVIEPPTPGQGARRVWSDSVGAIWVSEWNSGQLSRYVPETGEWAS